MDRPDPKTILTEEEQVKVWEAWNAGKTSIKDIVLFACGEGYDGRSKKFVAVKDLLASEDKKATTPEGKERKKFELSEENKKFIKEHAFSENPLKPLEISRIVTGNENLSGLSPEFKIVRAYIDALDPKRETSKYYPPRSLDQALARVVKYVGSDLEVKTLTVHQKDCLTRLMKYLNTYRFVIEVNSLVTSDERDLYESQFIRFTHDKPDLTEEDIDMYINVCMDVIMLQHLKKQKKTLEDARDAQMEDDHFPMALVEAINKIQSDIDDNLKRQKNSLEALNKKRSDRLDQQQQSYGSVLNLVEAMRGKETKEHWLKLADKRQRVLEQEKERLGDLDELMFQVFGIAKEEI